MKRMTTAEILDKYTSQFSVDRLRFNARNAYLDGRTAYAKELNRRADILDKARREKVA